MRNKIITLYKFLQDLKEKSNDSDEETNKTIDDMIDALKYLIYINDKVEESWLKNFIIGTNKI